MDETGYITFSGIESVRGGSYTLAHGVSPGIAIITAYPQPNPPADIGTLSITFGSVRIEFYDCLLDSLTYSHSNEKIATCVIKDRRWRWANPVISGRYNIRDDAGNLKDYNEKTPQELATLLLEKLGEKEFDVTQLPNDGRPYVDWDYANAAAELQSLCESYGCSVVLGINGKVRICKAGEGESLPELESISSGGIVIDPAETPDKIVMYGEPDEFQGDFYIPDAVGLDTDGAIKLIGDLSYKPSAADGGWAKADIDGYSFMCIADYTQRTLAQRYVFRCYRPSGLKEDGTIGGDLEVQGFMPDALKDNGVELTNFKQIEWLPHQLETRQSAEGETALGPVVYGAFFDGRDQFVNNIESTDYNKALNQESPEELDAKMLYRGRPREELAELDMESGGFGVDGLRHLVFFSQPVYIDTVSGSNVEYGDAKIYLRIAFRVRKEDTLEYVHTTVEKDLGGKAPTLYVKMPGVTRKLAPRFDRSGKTTGYIVDNEQEFKEQAQFYADAIAAEFFRPPGYTYTYDEIVPINPDGAIRQVSWIVGDGSVSRTIAQQNNDVQSYLPTYEERKQRIKTRELTRIFDDLNRLIRGKKTK